MYSLSEEDLRIQAEARLFADELIPHEPAAELAGGEIPGRSRGAHKARAIELGLFAANMPSEVGGGGRTSLQQVLIQEQVGRVTNALAWVCATPPSWLPAVATPGQVERYVRPAARGERERVLRDHRGGRGLRRRRDRGHRQAGRRRLPAQRRQVARDLVLLGGLRVLPGQADRRRARRGARDAASRPAEPRRPGGPDAGLHAHVVRRTITRSWPSRTSGCPPTQLVGAEGDGMSFAYEWFRFERLMVAARCLGAAERLVAEMTAFAKERVGSRAGRSPSSARCRRCSPTA